MKTCPICQSQYPNGEIFCPTDGARIVTTSQMEIASTASDDPLVGNILDGRYKVLKRIGEGGMGIVYEALHVSIEKKVALKVLRDDFSSRPEVVERFRQEAKSASRIGHEHIVDISDFGETPGGQSYFVMEMLVGEDLAGVLSRERTLAVRRAARILVQCCKALGAAHSKGIVHRDMKPENIYMVRRDDDHDFVKIVDFGIAKMSDIDTPGAPGRKLTKTGMIFGTPEYMSPEQAAGKSLDHRVDIYALGVILFELLTGRVPFVGDTFMGVLTQHMFEPPPPLREVHSATDVPSEVEAIIYKALAKDPNARFQSMDEMARALAQTIDPGAQGTFPPAADTLRGIGDPVKSQGRGPRVFEPAAATQFEVAYSEASPETKKSNKGLFAVLGGVALAVFAAGALYVASNRTPEVPPARPAGIATTPTPPVTPEPTPPVIPVATDPPVVEPTRVTVRVTTNPVGAEIEVEGRGLVCSASPCEISSGANETITVVAKKGRATVSRQITPSADFDLDLQLPRSSGGATKAQPTTPTAPTQPANSGRPDVFAECREACHAGLRPGPWCPPCEDLNR
jgi:serine/threonine protein kinase